MLFFEIRENLEERELDWKDIPSENAVHPVGGDPESAVPFVTVLSKEEWKEWKSRFNLRIEPDPEMTITMTKAEVNYDCLTGSFFLPDRDDPSRDGYSFAFALDEKGIAFIDETGTAEQIIRRISMNKRWRKPSLGRFLYDFLDQIIKGDLRILERYEDELEEIEQKIDRNEAENTMSRTNAIRSDVRKLLIHYDQMIDLGQELEENENGFFDQENLRSFRLFLGRMERLYGTASSLRDFTMQIADLNKAHLELRQNHIMTILTVVTTIVMPLTLITGWYGMNFRYMPELETRWGYPLIFLVCMMIIIGSLIYFKKKQWL